MKFLAASDHALPFLVDIMHLWHYLDICYIHIQNGELLATVQFVKNSQFLRLLQDIPTAIKHNIDIDSLMADFLLTHNPPLSEPFKHLSSYLQKTDDHTYKPLIAEYSLLKVADGQQALLILLQIYDKSRLLMARQKVSFGGTNIFIEYGYDET